jgi:hypothetical protein
VALADLRRRLTPCVSIRHGETPVKVPLVHNSRTAPKRDRHPHRPMPISQRAHDLLSGCPSAVKGNALGTVLTERTSAISHSGILSTPSPQWVESPRPGATKAHPYPSTHCLDNPPPSRSRASTKCRYACRSCTVPPAALVMEGHDVPFNRPAVLQVAPEMGQADRAGGVELHDIPLLKEFSCHSARVRVCSLTSGTSRPMRGAGLL